MKFKIYLTWAFLALLLMGCSNNSVSDLSDPVFVENVTYTHDIKPIIDNSCIVCHQTPPLNGAPMSLATYELVKDAIINRPLIDRISLPQGASGMMPNGGTRLPQSSIDLFIRWKEQGLQQ